MLIKIKRTAQVICYFIIFTKGLAFIRKNDFNNRKRNQLFKTLLKSWTVDNLKLSN